MEASKEKLKFYCWVSKWTCNKYIPAEEIVPQDTPQLTSILQAMGYKLESFEHQPSTKEENVHDNKFNEIKIEVSCRKSGLRAILTKQDTVCNCPNAATASDAKLWTVSGCGPSVSQDNLNKINETYSSLLPIVSKEKSQLVKEVINKLFSIINATDINQNQTKNATKEKIRENSFGRAKSLENITKKPELRRQATWEVDPKTTPPLVTSSPIITELCKSVAQISLQADKDQILTEILRNVKENVENALSLLPQNNTFTKTNVKRVSNIRGSPVVVTPTRSTTGTSTPELPVRKASFIRSEEKRITPKKSITAVADKRYLGIVSKISTGIRKKTDLLKPTTSRSKLYLSSNSPHANQSASPNPGNLENKRPALATITKLSTLKSSNSNLAASVSTNTIPKPKSYNGFGFKKTSSRTGSIKPLINNAK